MHYRFHINKKYFFHSAWSGNFSTSVILVDKQKSIFYVQFFLLKTINLVKKTDIQNKRCFHLMQRFLIWYAYVYMTEIEKWIKFKDLFHWSVLKPQSVSFYQLFLYKYAPKLFMWWGAVKDFCDPDPLNTLGAVWRDIFSFKFNYLCTWLYNLKNI